MKASGSEGRFASLWAAARRSAGRPRWSRQGLLVAAWAVVTVTAIIAGVVSLTSSSDSPRSRAVADTVPAHQKKSTYLLPVAALVSDGKVPKPSMAGDTGTVGIPAGTVPRPTTPTNNGDAASQGIATYSGGSGTMTPAGIATLALEAGCAVNVAPIATAIAMAESGGSPSAQGDITLMTPVWDWSAGLWQIRGLRSQRGTGGLRDSVANQDAVTNAAAMKVISDGCTTWYPWSTYTNGAYQGYLSIANQAVAYVLAYYRSHGSHFPAVAAPDPNAVIPVAAPGGAAVAARPGATTAGRTTSAAHRSAPKPASSVASAGRTSPASASSTPGPAKAPSAPKSTAASKKKIVLPTVSLPVHLPLPTPSGLLPTVTLPAITLPVLPGLPGLP